MTVIQHAANCNVSLIQCADNTCNIWTNVFAPGVSKLFIFHADNGVVVKETIVAIYSYHGCMRIIPQLHSRLIRSGEVLLVETDVVFVLIL